MLSSSSIKYWLVARSNTIIGVFFIISVGDDLNRHWRSGLNGDHRFAFCPVSKFVTGKLARQLTGVKRDNVGVALLVEYRNKMRIAINVVTLLKCHSPFSLFSLPAA